MPRNKHKKIKEYAIVGKYSKEVIGTCTEDDKSNVEKEEPGCTLVEIPDHIMYEYDNMDWDTAILEEYIESIGVLNQ